MDCICGCGSKVPRKLVSMNMEASELALELLAWDRARANHALDGPEADEVNLIVDDGAHRYRQVLETLHGERPEAPAEELGGWLRSSRELRNQLPRMRPFVDRGKPKLTDEDLAQIDRVHPELSFTGGQPVLGAAAFVEDYGKFWQRWDVEAFVDLFSHDVVYVAHPQEIVLGREALRRYLEKEKVAQGEVSVLIGRPMVDGLQVFAEFWVKAIRQDEKASIAGCLVARLDGPNGRCTHFREYWFDLEGHVEPFEGWGR